MQKKQQKAEKKLQKEAAQKSLGVKKTLKRGKRGGIRIRKGLTVKVPNSSLDANIESRTLYCPNERDNRRQLLLLHWIPPCLMMTDVKEAFFELYD